MFLNKIGRFVSLEVEKNHQSWETVLVTKLCLCQKKPKTPTKMKILDKKNDVLDFWNSLSVMFLDYKKTVFEGVFGFFEDGTPYFDCIRWN